MIAPQDTSLQAQASALAAFALERAARLRADTIEARQIALPAPGHRPDIVKIGAVAAAAVLTLVLAFR